MSQSAPRPDGMLIVTLDRLPGWMLSATGCTWVGMPVLDSLAARGIVFDLVIAHSDYPHTVLAALWGGERAGSPRAGSPSDVPWPLFAAAGWSPTLITDDFALAGAAASVAAVHHVPALAATQPCATEAETNLGRLFSAAAQTVATGGHRLVWCHATSLGVAWDAPPRFRDHYADPDDPPPPATAAVPTIAVAADTDPDLVVGIRQVMAGQLTLFDACLGHLLEAVAGRPGQWTVLVAGVRGIGLGLHGRIGCGPLPPYSELVHLPAIFVDHSGRMAAQRYGGLILPADLGATLASLAGIAPSSDNAPRHGRDLTSLLDNWQLKERDRVICHGSAGRGVATPAWHLVLPEHTGAEPPRPRLFAKPDDAFELNDVADRCPAVTEELAALAGADPSQAWTVPLSNAARNGV